MKHKHADLIHAWADGAEIQMNTADGWKDINPSFVPTEEYRIKPEENKPVVRWLWAFKDIDSVWTHTDNFWTEEEAVTGFIKLEWSRTEFPE